MLLVRSVSLTTVLLLSLPSFAGDQPRPTRLSGTAEGTVQIQKDERYQNFVYHTSPGGAEVGVWQGHGRTGKPGEAPVLTRDDYSELMFILEGSVTLAEPDGKEWLLKVGDAVIVPRGVPYYWRLGAHQWVKKVYVVFDQAKSAAALPYHHIIRMEPKGPAGIGLEEVEGPSKGHTYYASPQGGGAGVWQTKPYVGRADLVPKTYSEVMFFLQGEGTLAVPGGGTLPFKGGDAVLIPKGAAYQWKSQEALKYWVSFDGPAPSQR